MVKYYADFLQFVKSLGETQYPEDLVQELFIHIHERPNTTKSYCLTWLQWRVLDLYREKKKIQKIELEDNFATFDMEFEVDIFNKVDWFHKEVFDLWADGMSIREISKQTKISVSSIRNSIDKIKQTWHEKREN